MRFTAYASASVALATSVILKALHERPNFYSACVYLGQSSACIMILTNLTLLALGCVLFGLQKLLYGPLRPIEVEQLYEKAWFAITETCLAMTIFREEVGAWFIVMFISLLIGKVWGWIGEGRVEVLEQQPPANPRLFHARLSSSLALSFLFTTYMLNYSISTVQQQARPNMMVMFAFEFAVLTVTSMSTCARYGISLREAAVIRHQTAQRLQERRRQILREREEATRRAEEVGEYAPEFPPVEEEINELDIDVPGWEDKGRWTFYLDLATDFLKLILYLTFFCVLCIFYGMPIHIIRDVALTVRSFYNRVTDFIKYRHATRDMNERYPDATTEEIAREDTCIICREPMQAWTPPGPVQGEGPAPMEERLRPKKLPCGHILHFACLRSWLERQQKCPTCRQDVVAAPSPQPAQQQNGAGAPIGNGENPVPPRNDRPNDRPRQNRIRFFNLGPLRLGFGAGNDAQALQDEMLNQRPRRQQRHGTDRTGPIARQFGLNFRPGRNQPAASSTRSSQISRMERQLRQEINSLNLQHRQLGVIQRLQNEYWRLRVSQTVVENGDPDRALMPEGGLSPAQGYSLSPQHASLHSGHPDLPQGVTIPEGWQFTPLVPYSPPQVSLPSFGSLQPTFGVGAQMPNPLVMSANAEPNAMSAIPPLSHAAQDGAAASTILANLFATQAADNGSIQPAALAPSAATSADQESNSQEGRTERPVETPDLNPHADTSVAPAIPQWGSRSPAKSPQVASAPLDSSDVGQSSAVDVQADGETHTDKGKAKAATVEDAADEGT